MAEGKYKEQGRIYNPAADEIDEKSAAKRERKLRKEQRRRAHRGNLTPAELFQAGQGGYGWYMANVDSPEEVR